MRYQKEINSPQSAQDQCGHTLSGYLGVRKAASYLSVSERFLRGQLGKLKHYKWGRKILFKRDELDDWMEGFRVRPAGDQRDGLDQIADDIARGILN